MAGYRLPYLIGVLVLLLILLAGCAGTGGGSSANLPPFAVTLPAGPLGPYPAPGIGMAPPASTVLSLPIPARSDTVPVIDTTKPEQAYVWRIETADSDGVVGVYASLGLNPAGFPHISHCSYICDPYCRCRLKHTYRDASGWRTEFVDPTRYVGAPSLVMDSEGRPHLTYSTGGNPSQLRYAYFDGSDWISQTVTTGGGPVLALDTVDQPHIAYYAGGLQYASYDGAAWQIETVDSGDGVGNYTSLALDAAGWPHLSYVQYSFGGVGNLRYAHRDAQGWHIEQLGTTGDGRGTSLALDAAGRPHISYQEAAAGAGWLNYTYFDGQSWQVERIDGDWSGDTGENSSLKLDAADHPHVSYMGKNVDLKYAYHDGTAWQIETPDSVGNVGLYSSLALDNLGQPHIAYGGSGGLKYAYRTPCVPPEEADIAGLARQPMGVTGLYSATYAPPNATLPLTFAWNNGAVSSTAAYSWSTIGSYTVTVTATSLCGQAHGMFTVTVFCQPLAGVPVSGPSALLAGQEGAYEAAPQPLTASLPLTFTWDNGASGPTAVYSWTLPGTQTLTVSATNACGGVRGGVFVTRVWAEWPYRLHLPLVGR